MLGRCDGLLFRTLTIRTLHRSEVDNNKHHKDLIECCRIRSSSGAG